MRKGQTGKGLSKPQGLLYNNLKSKHPINNLMGDVFGKMLVLYPTSKRGSSNGAIYWRCQCDCGEFKDVREDGLVGGNVKSCGKKGCREYKK